MKKVDRGITMINHTQAEAMGKLSNVLCQVGVTTIIAKFIILDIPIDRDAPIVIGRGFLHMMGSILNTLERIFSTFDGVCHQIFRAARFDILRIAASDSDDEEDYGKVNPTCAYYNGSYTSKDTEDPSWSTSFKTRRTRKTSSALEDFFCVVFVHDRNITSETYDDDAGSSRSERSRHESVEEVLYPQVHHEFLLWEGCTRDAKSRYNTRLAQLLPRYIYSPCIVNWDVLNRMGCDGEIDDMLRIRVCEAESEEEVFTLMAWIRAFNITKPIYTELYHEFYSTYKFNEVYVDDELQSKKIIKFRLGGRAHNLTLLEFARRLGLYQAIEIEEDGFNVYFEGGLRSDENFNAADYWLSISQEEHLDLSRSHTSTIRSPILRVIYKMITYGLCQRTTEYDKWMKKKGVGTQKESQICCGQFISKLVRKYMVLTEVVVRSLSAPIYCRDLDTTTLRDFIDSNGRMEIRQDVIEWMKYRQSYHWDRYHGVFEHLARVYSVPLQGAYNPPSYAQPQYDQYYQQYPPPPPQYQPQQQQDDDE
ncbi:hypothetical protein Tco_0970031 [Tanacetum coccineum]